MNNHNTRQRFNIFLPNRIIWYLTFSDGFNWGAYYAVMGLIGLFLAGKFSTNVEQIVGFGFGAYLVSRSISQLIVANIADRIPGMQDEILLLIFGAILMGGPFVLFPFLTDPSQYYALLAVIGLGAAMNLVGWRKLFAKNLDKNREGMDYGIYDSVYSLTSAALSVGAGLIANISDLAFNLVVVAAGISMMLSGLWAIAISRSLSKEQSSSSQTV